MEKIISTLLLALFLAQGSQGDLEKSFKELIIEKVEEVNKELEQPLLSEIIKLNETIYTMKNELENRIKLANVNKQLLAIINLVEVEDDCKNLTDYLPEAQKIVEQAFYMSTDLSAALSDVVVDAMNCLNINIFKAVSCLLNEVGEIKQIYEKYKPELTPMLQSIKGMLQTLFTLFEQCIEDL